ATALKRISALRHRSTLDTMARRIHQFGLRWCRRQHWNLSATCRRLPLEPDQTQRGQAYAQNQRCHPKPMTVLGAGLTHASIARGGDGCQQRDLPERVRKKAQYQPANRFHGPPRPGPSSALAFAVLRSL